MECLCGDVFSRCKQVGLGTSSVGLADRLSPYPGILLTSYGVFTEHPGFNLSHGQ
jgi:hypothetical protein